MTRIQTCDCGDSGWPEAYHYTIEYGNDVPVTGVMVTVCHFTELSCSRSITSMESLNDKCLLMF